MKVVIVFLYQSHWVILFLTIEIFELIHEKAVDNNLDKYSQPYYGYLDILSPSSEINEFD